MRKTINLKKSGAILALVLPVLFQSWTSAAADSKAPPLPRYRNVPLDPKAASQVQGLTLRLVSDADFPPFSYQADDGLQKGIAVDVAKAACQKLRLTCEMKLLPFDRLLDALQKNEADIVVTGMRIDQALLARVDVTRPYYVSTGAFAVRSGTKNLEATPESLAGRKLGYVAGTAHARFVERYFPRSDRKSFGAAGELLKALKSGSLDAAFGDTVQIQYWLAGTASEACCRMLARPFVDRETISRDLGFIVSKDRGAVRDAFDVALDQLEAEGVTAAIFARYAPFPLW